MDWSGRRESNPRMKLGKLREDIDIVDPRHNEVAVFPAIPERKKWTRVPSKITDADRDIKYIAGFGIVDELFLYVFECAGYHKVGYSRSPFRRKEDMQVANPLKIRFVSYWRVRHGDGAAFEKKVHALLADYRVRGEWFSAPLPIVKAAIRFVGNNTPITEDSIQVFCRVAMDEDQLDAGRMGGVDVLATDPTMAERPRPYPSVSAALEAQWGHLPSDSRP